MGIRNLHTFLRKTVPIIYQEVSLTRFAYKRIAIDLSIYLCKYKAFYKERWLDAFLSLVSCLRENEIHFVFIFDSKSPPEKDQEKRHRSQQREKLKSRITDMEKAYKLLMDKDEISPCIEKYFHFKTNREASVAFVGTEIDRLKSNLLEIQPEDFVLVKQLFDLLQIPYYYGVSEAEATCAHLCLNGDVDAVMTEDTDILAYGCPVNLHKINIQNNTIILIEMKNLLTELDMAYEQFRDFCIMCGTDYNTNIPKIGPDRSYKLIKEHKCIENLDGIVNTDILKYTEVRRLFTNDIDFNIPMIYCGQPDINALQLFVFTNNCYSDISKIMNAFLHSNYIMFESYNNNQTTLLGNHNILKNSNN
jgi:5'-3' exonuclease